MCRCSQRTRPSCSRRCGRRICRCWTQSFGRSCRGTRCREIARSGSTSRWRAPAATRFRFNSPAAGCCGSRTQLFGRCWTRSARSQPGPRPWFQGWPRSRRAGESLVYGGASHLYMTTDTANTSMSTETKAAGHEVGEKRHHAHEALAVRHSLDLERSPLTSRSSPCMAAVTM